MLKLFVEVMQALGPCDDFQTPELPALAVYSGKKILPHGWRRCKSEHRSFTYVKRKALRVYALRRDTHKRAEIYTATTHT